MLNNKEWLQNNKVSATANDVKTSDDDPKSEHSSSQISYLQIISFKSSYHQMQQK